MSSSSCWLEGKYSAEDSFLLLVGWVYDGVTSVVIGKSNIMPHIEPGSPAAVPLTSLASLWLVGISFWECEGENEIYFLSQKCVLTLGHFLIVLKFKRLLS